MNMTISIADCPTHPDPVAQVWLENRCLRGPSMQVYAHWVRRFQVYCRTQHLTVASQLTLAGVGIFATWYAQERGIDRARAFAGARTALHAWALALEVLGEGVPPWTTPAPPTADPDPVLALFADYLADYRGDCLRTQHKEATTIAAFLTFLQARHRTLAQLTLQDIDAYILECAPHYATTTLADICSALRSFCRFLHVTGRLDEDLAPAVMAPNGRRDQRPLRALPWAQVCQLLNAVDRTTVAGQRDYALLLMMSIYGLGAGEVCGLRLDDIDWRAATVHVMRPKTGVSILLPLLPGVAAVLVDYLRQGRPQHAPTRHLFLALHTPHRPLSTAGPVRHIIVKHARAAGITATYLGSHVLRHSHACRELEQGVPPKVIGDILGHRDPDSTSAYLRIATERLREVSLVLPV
ncbi:site-specific integrase [uncultured Thiodictyon sp.]|uniref:site-specific integrase n=1 Tax=uncultured Thiodictyon sp. TaxID=1846217 RepID=UPI0025F0D33A|nr:site-specific integrase [uncultured Thiodictyon sp.]